MYGYGQRKDTQSDAARRFNQETRLLVTGLAIFAAVLTAGVFFAAVQAPMMCLVTAIFGQLLLAAVFMRSSTSSPRVGS